MKRSAWILALPLAFLMVAQPACQQAAPPTNRDTAQPNTNTTREVVDTASIERELLRIENDWPRVMKEKDAAAVQRVEADDVVLVYPDGGIGGKAQDVKDMETGALTVDSLEMTDMKVNVLNANAAVVNGRTIVKGGKYKTPDGKSIDISGEYRFIDTFAKRDGQWKLVAGASVPVRQPTGAAASSMAGASPMAKMSPAVKASPSMTTKP